MRRKFFCFGKNDYCNNDGDGCINNCPFYNGKGGETRSIPSTNGEALRALPDEGLASWLHSNFEAKSAEDWLFWLQKEVGE